MKTLSLLSTRLYCAAAVKRQKGATMVEYVLLAALIGVIAALALDPLGTGVQQKFLNICSSITGSQCSLKTN